jgi:Flp pilus assembly protein TadG
MRRHRTPPRDDRGVVALEFVMILPFIIGLILCSITVASLFQTKSRVVGAARDYARALAIRPGSPAPADPNTTDGITVELDPSSALCPALSDPAYQTTSPPIVSVLATTRFDIVNIPFIGTWTNVDITEKASMPCG